MLATSSTQGNAVAAASKRQQTPANASLASMNSSVGVMCGSPVVQCAGGAQWVHDAVPATLGGTLAKQARHRWAPKVPAVDVGCMRTHTYEPPRPRAAVVPTRHWAKGTLQGTQTNGEWTVTQCRGHSHRPQCIWSVRHMGIQRHEYGTRTSLRRRKRDPDCAM